MKQFEISEQQMQQIANALGECPAKHVFSAIDVLRNLKEISLTQPQENNNE